MGTFDSISQLPPAPSIRPRSQPLPHRKPREDNPDPRSRRKPPPEPEDTEADLPHIDEYA